MAIHQAQIPHRGAVGSQLGEETIELQRPAPDRLVADLDAALRKQFLNVPKALRELEIQPNRMADHVRRKPVALMGNRPHGRLHPDRTAISGDELAFA